MQKQGMISRTEQQSIKAKCQRSCKYETFEAILIHYSLYIAHFNTHSDRTPYFIPSDSCYPTNPLSDISFA